MSVSVTFHGHSTLSIDVNGTKLLIDPFFTGNPMAKITGRRCESGLHSAHTRS